MKVLIVGGVAAGASTAARIRRLDEMAEILILERDQYVSFANCGLPYHIGKIIPDRNSLLLHTPESLKQKLNIEVRTQHEVIKLHPASKEVEVKDINKGSTYKESYDKLVLCPGASPIRPPIPGANTPGVFVLRNIPDMDRIISQIDKGAKRAVVIGGSYIGLEVAEGFHAKGLHTTILEMSDRLMPWLDKEMTRILHFHVNSKKVDVKLGVAAKSITSKGNMLEIQLSNGEILETDVIVMATGVRPNVELAKEAGLKIGTRGGIAVNAQMQTSDPDIFAAGDAVETPHLITGAATLSMLAGPANRQGRIAADVICGKKSSYRGTQGTSVVKAFDMSVGGSGLTEQDLQRIGMDFRKIYLHPNDHAEYFPGASPMFIKVLFEPKEGKILGAQVLGWSGVDKRIDVFAMAIRAGMTIFDLEHLELSYAPPYASAKDPVNMAGFHGSNLLRGDIHLCYSEEFPECAERVTILDVRTRPEFDHWHIPGAILIPQTELRARIDELPKGKPIYTYCRSGVRSYMAYCILKQRGFKEVFSLAGGLMTYHGYHKTPLASGSAGYPVVTHAEDILAQKPGAVDHL